MQKLYCNECKSQALAENFFNPPMKFRNSYN
ncbi:hypothetical protein MPF_0563 [Methanohalophilus portucalensis FDF-1]|uniref:Uncharacterized protein n=1 Tax=Methanohalophilus portucalensis FDF-1 TaxID=523843 RepID=A0A1L9C5G8_9EURY|nr:hypothetical protein MPF_0563 [Methanohalophilus portucalensis FDF-1]